MYIDRHCGALGGPLGQAAAPSGPLVAVVDVVDADEIVLGEVAAGLHLSISSRSILPGSASRCSQPMGK